jgi:hypothetical protein
MIRTFRVGIVALVLAGAAVLGFAGPASAGCSGKICVYQYTYFGNPGDYWNFGDSNFNGDHFLNGENENDAISSIDCWYQYETYWFTDSWWSGSRLNAAAWCTYYTLSSTFDNRLSSWGFAP